MNYNFVDYFIFTRSVQCFIFLKKFRLLEKSLKDRKLWSLYILLYGKTKKHGLGEGKGKLRRLKGIYIKTSFLLD